MDFSDSTDRTAREQSEPGGMSGGDKSSTPPTSNATEDTPLGTDTSPSETFSAEPSNAALPEVPLTSSDKAMPAAHDDTAAASWPGTETADPDVSAPPAAGLSGAPTPLPAVDANGSASDSSEPTAAIDSQPHAAPAPSRTGRKFPQMAMGIFALIVLVGLAFGAYHFGNSHGYKNGKSAQFTAVTAAALKVPANATMIAQCTPGEGTQYVLPANIPQGPIYNVWNGKVTGLEYMLGAGEIANMKTQNLSLMSQQYNHIDVMYEAAGHAGFTEPHYHVILSLVPYSEEQKITCGGSSGMSM